MQPSRALSIAGLLPGSSCPAVPPHHYTRNMALRLYAATTSAGKLRDFRTAAQAFSIDST